MLSQIKEYIKIFPEIYKNRKLIFNSIIENIKYPFLKKSIKKEIKLRRSICKNCNYMSENYKKMGFYMTSRKDKHCALCGCNIFLKTACLECNCGIETYNEKTKSNLELKWKNIIK